MAAARDLLPRGPADVRARQHELDGVVAEREVIVLVTEQGCDRLTGHPYDLEP
jgi:hypothetical protein